MNGYTSVWDWVMTLMEELWKLNFDWRKTY